MKLSDKYDLLESLLKDSDTQLVLTGKLLKELKKKYAIVTKVLDPKHTTYLDDAVGTTEHIFTVFVYGKSQYESLIKAEEIFETLANHKKIEIYSGIEPIDLDNGLDINVFRIQI